jgi:hypothetical protein
MALAARICQVMLKWFQGNGDCYLKRRYVKKANRRSSSAFANRTDIGIKNGAVAKATAR